MSGIPVTGVYSQCWATKNMFAACQTWIDLCDFRDPLKQIAIGYAVDELIGFPRIIVNPESIGRTRVGLTTFNSEPSTVHASLQAEVLPFVAAQTLEDEMNWFTQTAGDIACEFEEISNKRELVNDVYPRELFSMNMMEPPDRVPPEEIMQFVPNNEKARYPVWVMVWEITYVP